MSMRDLIVFVIAMQMILTGKEAEDGGESSL